MDQRFSWLIFSYKVASEPSTLRVRIWRNLKDLGVVYIQQSVCVVPDISDVRKKIQLIQKLILEHSGESTLLEVEQLAELTEGELIKQFNQQRSLEWQEFMEQSDGFLEEIRLETAKKNFTFREVEENEADLLKLKRWFRKILKRDFFFSPMLAASKERLDQCECVLSEFTKSVYSLEGFSEGEIDPNA